MRDMTEIAKDPEPGDAIEYQGKVFEVVAIDHGKIIYRIHQAKPKRAHWFTKHAWFSLCNALGCYVSDYSSKD